MSVQRVHNHRPYRPVCNERMVDGRLRGACLNDDGSDAVSPAEAEVHRTTTNSPAPRTAVLMKET